MSRQHTYEQIAGSWDLWNEFVNADGNMSRGEFDDLDDDAKIAMQREAFGEDEARANLLEAVELSQGYYGWSWKLRDEDDGYNGKHREREQAENEAIDYIQRRRRDLLPA